MNTNSTTPDSSPTAPEFDPHPQWAPEEEPEPEFDPHQHWLTDEEPELQMPPTPPASPEQQPQAAPKPGSTSTVLPPTKKYPEELRAILERAQRGDRTVLAELKKAFDQYPEWTDLFGDLVEYTRQTLLDLVTDGSFVAKEAIVRKTDALRAALLGDSVSPVESLLLDQVCLDWMSLQVSQLRQSAGQKSNPNAHACTKAEDQRVASAHRRFATSLKTLMTTRKLQRNTPTPLKVYKSPAAG